MTHQLHESYLPVGTPVCVYGYDEVQAWLEVTKRLLYGTVGRYVDLEIPPEHRDYLGKTIDTAIIITLSKEDALWNCRLFLMIPCYTQRSGDFSDINAFNYAVWEDVFSDLEAPIPYDIWKLATRQVAWRAWLMVVDPPSESFIALRARFSKSGE